MGLNSWLGTVAGKDFGAAVLLLLAGSGFAAAPAAAAPPVLLLVVLAGFGLLLILVEPVDVPEGAATPLNAAGLGLVFTAVAAGADTGEGLGDGCCKLLDAGTCQCTATVLLATPGAAAVLLPLAFAAGAELGCVGAGAGAGLAANAAVLAVLAVALRPNVNHPDDTDVGVAAAAVAESPGAADNEHANNVELLVVLHIYCCLLQPADMQHFSEVSSIQPDATLLT